MDLVILIVLLLIVVIAFKKFSSFVYCTVIIDLFLRILTMIHINLAIPEFSSFVVKYVPESIPTILAKYSTGIFYTVLIWGYIALYVLFEVYIVKTFFKKK